MRKGERGKREKGKGEQDTNLLYYSSIFKNVCNICTMKVEDRFFKKTSESFFLQVCVYFYLNQYSGSELII